MAERATATEAATAPAENVSLVQSSDNVGEANDPVAAATEENKPVDFVFQALDDDGDKEDLIRTMVKDEAVAKSRLQRALESTPGVEGLEVFWGNKVLEIRTKTDINKGYALRRLVAEDALEAIILMGDDTTDLDAVRDRVW